MKAIDQIILDELADRPNVTAVELSRTWGEDSKRCLDWLERFRKQGLCCRSDTPGPSGYHYYNGHPVRIGEFLRAKNAKK